MPDATAQASPAPPVSGWPGLKSAWPLLLGLLALAIPTLASLGETVWSTEAGAHGPIILFTAAWLLWREADSFRKLGKPGAAWLVWLVLLPSLAMYAFSRAFDFISLEVLGVYGAFVAALYSLYGLRPLLKNWFPMFYLGFCIPPPGWLIDELTAPLKQFISFVSTQLASLVGIPIMQEGVTLYVAQYQLLVEDACSGMNSLVGLTAISLFYIYLLRGSSVRYSILLTLFVIPIAIVGNIIRILILILLTYFFGDEVAQGFLHMAAGITLFAIDLLLVFALDSLLIKLVPRSWRTA